MNPVPLSKVSVVGSAPATSPVSIGLAIGVPFDVKLRIWSDAACVTNGPGLKLKSSDPVVPLIVDVFVVTL